MGGWADAQGVGYVPGLEKIVGLEQIEQLGSRPARTRDLGDALSGTLSLLNQLESLVTAGPPWCYLVDTVAVREAWRDAVEGYIELRKALYQESRTGGDRRYPRYFQDGGEVRIADHDPGWWMTVSEVTRIVLRPDGTSEPRRVIMAGPKMLPSFRSTENLPYHAGPAAMSSPAVLGPLDYYADWARYDLATGQNIGDDHPAARAAMDAYGEGQAGNKFFDDDRVFESRKGFSNVSPQCKGPNEFSGPSSRYRTRLSPFESKASVPCQKFMQYRYSGNTVPGEAKGWGGWEPNRAWPIPFGGPMVWVDHAGQMSAKIDGQPTQVITGNILDMVIEPWCERVFKMQMQHLDTLWCAYVHPNYPAFHNSPGLRLLLAGRRNQLLDSPSRFAVHAPDVIDNVGPGSYREALMQRDVCFPTGKTATCDLSSTPVNPDGPGPKFQVMTFVPPSQPEPEPEPLPDPVPPGGQEDPSEPDVRLSTEPAEEGSKLPLVIGAAAIAAAAYKAGKR